MDTSASSNGSAGIDAVKHTAGPMTIAQIVGVNNPPPMPSADATAASVPPNFERLVRRWMLMMRDRRRWYPIPIPGVSRRQRRIELLCARQELAGNSYSRFHDICVTLDRCVFAQLRLGSSAGSTTNTERFDSRLNKKLLK